MTQNSIAKENKKLRKKENKMQKLQYITTAGKTTSFIITRLPNNCTECIEEDPTRYMISVCVIDEESDSEPEYIESAFIYTELLAAITRIHVIADAEFFSDISQEIMVTVMSDEYEHIEDEWFDIFETPLSVIQDYIDTTLSNYNKETSRNATLSLVKNTTH